MDSAPDPLLTVEEVATYLNVPKATVYGWNHDGTGPRFHRIGRHVRYRRSDLEQWIEQRAAA